MRKTLNRLLRVAPIALLLWAGVASAQSATGTLTGVVTDAATGKAVAGALVIATSPALQGEQTAITDGGGNYLITLLPPGRYKVAVQLQGYKPAERTDITLRVDFTLRANIAIVPEAVQMDEQVVKTGMAPVINIGSADAGTVVSREFLSTVPTSRTYEGTAIVAPTAQRDYYGISFAGATSPENNYIIDGLRVSDPSYGTLGTNLLSNFVEQLDLKVGQFMPEYGYSSAGIINTVTKSGSNEFHGSIWGNITPGILSPASPATWRNGEAIASYSSPYKGSYDADFGVEVGGPIVKDKLWFYAGFAPRLTYNARTLYYQSRTPSAANPAVAARDAFGQYVMSAIGADQVYGSGQDTYYGIAKLTFLINENNTLALAANTQPTHGYGQIGSNGNPSALTQDYNQNSTNATLRYNGKFFDKHLLVDAVVGYYDAPFKDNAITVAGVNTHVAPSIQWRDSQRLQNFNPAVASLCPSTAGSPGTNVGCFVQNYFTGGWGYTNADLSNTRWAGNVSLTGLFSLGGQHQLKAGAQIDYSTYDNDRFYTGGVAWRAYGRASSIGGAATGRDTFFMYRSYGETLPPFISGTRGQSWQSVPGNVGGPNHDPTQPGHSVAQTNTWANGYYIQDSWTIANVLTLNFGVRLDTQNMKAPSYEAQDPTTPTFDISNMWAPRVQAIWDFTGTGRGKVQGSWGRYYEAIPLDAALRGFGAERQVRGGYQMSTCNNVGTGTNYAGGTNQLAGATNSSADPARQCPNVYGLGVGEGPGPNNATVPLTSLQSALGVGRGFSYTSIAYSPVAPDLKGQYTDQFGGGIQYEILQDLSIGFDYLGRRLGNIIEDMSSDDGNNYFIANPSVSSPWVGGPGPYQGVTLNPKQAAGADLGQGLVYAVNWPAPKRTYDGFTVSMNKTFSKRWLANVSYTYSVLQGNFPGLFRSENAQLDPNITSEYDLVSLLGNKTGPLAGNRTNQIKAYGSYTHPISPTVTLVGGLGMTAMAGQPVGVLGAHPLYGAGESYLLPRGFAGNLPWTVNLDLSGKVQWNISGPYTLSFMLDIFNVLNLQAKQSVDQIYTQDFLNPAQGAACSSKDAISQQNVRQALAADCPDLPYLRTLDDRQPTPNLNYGQPQTDPAGGPAYQLPIRVRLGVALSF
jgi:hypothetical protein